MFSQLFSQSFNFNLSIALQALLVNKLRSMLTALGVIFGVAAVITMLAIGAGAQKELLAQMKLVGANNIVVTAKVPDDKQISEEQSGKAEQKKISNGLGLPDLKGISEVLGDVEKLSPEVVKETWLMREGIRKQVKLVGVANDYFTLTDFKLDRGTFFNDFQQMHGEPVCVVGNGIQTKFFKGANPVGKYIKCGENWLKVVGLLEERNISETSIKSLGIRDYNLDVYIPVKAMLLRYQNRSLITKSMLEKAAGMNEEEGAEPTPVDKNYHQLDKITIQLLPGSNMQAAAEVVSRLVQRRHGGVLDFEVSIPEMLIKQQQKTKDIFNFVLGAIAGISLLVGGIGIMNIMLASVLERTKEIGIRRAIGATQQDIVQQFLLEAILLSLGGAIIGLILGLSMSWIVDAFAGIETVVSWWSVVLSMAVSVTVGIVFGITPAKRAAELDPVEALRWE